MDLKEFVVYISVLPTARQKWAHTNSDFLSNPMTTPMKNRKPRKHKMLTSFTSKKQLLIKSATKHIPSCK